MNPAPFEDHLVKEYINMKSNTKITINNNQDFLVVRSINL